MLYLVGVALTTYNQIPGVDQRLSDLTAFYGDSGNRLLLLIGGTLLAFSAAFLLAFAAGFASSEPERDSQESFLARSAAGLFAACIAISSVALALVAAEVSLRSALQPPPELERWLAEFGYAVLLGAGDGRRRGDGLVAFSLGPARGPDSVHCRGRWIRRCGAVSFGAADRNCE